MPLPVQRFVDPKFSLKVGLSRSRRGFTLVETMVAMGLLVLVLLGSFSLLVGSYSTMRRTQETLYVNRLLETAIEMTRNLSFADIQGDIDGEPAGYANTSPITFSTNSTLLVGANNSVLYNKGAVASTDPKAEFSLQDATGRIFFDRINNDLYRVTARVDYTPYRLAPASKAVVTYVARNGINRR